MAYFPFMIDIEDKNCLVVGGGRIAYRKALDLLQFGARVTVISPNICSEIENIHDIEIIRKEYETADINHRFLVIAATNIKELNRNIAAECNERNILVNAVDIKDACSFIFPAIIKRDELVVSISTGGNSPAGAAFLKEKIEHSIPDNYERNLELLGRLRSDITKKVTDSALRKKLYYDLLKKTSKEGLVLSEKDVYDYIDNKM